MLLGFSIGLGAIAVDFGRVVLLRSQMQNYADAAALAGAVQLDGSDGARERATRVVQQAIGARSGLVEGDQQLAISGVTFYQSLDGGVLATGTLMRLPSRSWCNRGHCGSSSRPR